jgi:hypothetical protein
MKTLAALILAMTLALPAAAELPAAVRDLTPDARAPWRALGEGEMRWLGFRLYDARLWVSGERYADSEPFALQLSYAREISSDRLVSSSVSEMRRLGWRDEAQLRRWETGLAAIFPDVAPGHVIVGVSLPGRGAAFFHDGRPVGEVADPEFARAFFAIWLDARTRAPELRARLLQDS